MINELISEEMAKKIWQLAKTGRGWLPVLDNGTISCKYITGTHYNGRPIKLWTYISRKNIKEQIVFIR